ncbi:TIGR02302 family protein [Aliiroseovarius sp. S1339]|uniref:TIGR02302 family protein n=1 Tax=Aliiroseovarius sp. S1339 TaxID=2936990 RepID=UPI0020BECD3C|nr:TIGR02302 family protein [Aliiroseovarius sp. S1339]MCK8464622.1 TIGR02302 family protein [Aliiroseovarius sp. S1339]
MTRPTLPNEVQPHLRWPLRLTGAGMVLERFWHAFWPLATILLAAFAVWSFWTIGPSPAASGAMMVGAAIALIALIWGVRKFSWPSRAERLARLDDSLPGHPIAALQDEQATGRNDPASRDLWQAHLHRMAQRLKGVRPVAPDLRVALNDPYGLRLIAATGAALALGFTPWMDRAASVTGTNASAQPIASASWEGWIEPPGYTGRPSLYLADQPPGPLAVPTGSRLTLRLYGDLSAFTIDADLSGAPIKGPTLQSYVQIITKNSLLSIDGPGGATWHITAIGDTPPNVGIDGDLSRRIAGDFSLPFIATDDYAVTAGHAEASLGLDRMDRRHGLAVDPEPRPPLIVDLPLPYRGARTLIEGVLEENLIEHPWAGLPINLTLKVEDGAEQTGTSTPLGIILPARRFLHPVAKALVEQRRDLMWSRQNGRRVAQILRAVLNRPDDLKLPDGVYLRLRGGIRRLEAGIAFSDLPSGLPEDLRDEIATLLWDVAVELDDGRLADALARMQQAQDRLEQAMRDGASEEELAELMDEVREAMRDYMDQLAQNQQNAPQSDQPPPENGIEMSQADIEDMMDRIEELMREGREDEAMQMLDQLRQMMENMQMAQNGQPSQPGESAREGLQDTLREQQGLSDQAFRDLQEQGQGSQAGEAEGNEGRDGGQGRGQSHDGTGGQQGQDGEGAGPEQNNSPGQGNDLAQRQSDLQRQLEAQRRNLPGASDEAGQAARDALDEAGRAMGDAADALEQGDLPEALGRQADAMEALREGMRQFDEAMQNQQAQREGEQGSSPGEGRRSSQRDPLGRNPDGQSGAVGTDNPLEDGEDVYRRAQELMNELRRRSGDGDRPDLERDYLKRLLDQF